ncbi:MAG TPA: hypothetical protein VH560_01255 [Polyangia bacterium]|nr:hypothetical protein [Polyangia bacterium]
MTRAIAAVVIGALVAASAACSAKASGGGPSGAATDLPPPLLPLASAAAAPSERIPEFPSLDPSLWVNGAPVTFASLHNDVVLVEAWHRF